MYAGVKILLSAVHNPREAQNNQFYLPGLFVKCRDGTFTDIGSSLTSTRCDPSSNTKTGGLASHLRCSDLQPWGASETSCRVV